MSRKTLGLLGVCGVITVSASVALAAPKGAAKAPAKSTAAARKSAAPLAAQADLKDPKGETIGTVSFLQLEEGVKVSIEASKLSPGQHGIHFHESGKCEGPDFKSAGGHFNPAKKEHGLENPAGAHAGDLPNLVADAEGRARAEFTTERATLAAGENSLLKEGGTSVVIHAKSDDQKSQPAGAAGDRVACGVIAKAPAHP